MKEILILSLISIQSFAQLKIDGLDKFKINKTTVGFIDSLAKDNNLKIVKSYSSHRLYIATQGQMDDMIIEISYDTINEQSNDPYSHSCKYSRVFFLPRAQILGAEVEGLYLIFYRNRLIKMIVHDRNKLVGGLIAKYGEPSVKSKYTESNYYYKWANGDIICVCNQTWTEAYLDSANDILRECDKQSKRWIQK
ncbi:MAG: hypothetical protein QM734_14415 [Cyclobacteriaceae bacterium]